MDRMCNTHLTHMTHTAMIIAAALAAAAACTNSLDVEGATRATRVADPNLIRLDIPAADWTLTLADQLGPFHTDDGLVLFPRAAVEQEARKALALPAGTTLHSLRAKYAPGARRAASGTLMFTLWSRALGAELGAKPNRVAAVDLSAPVGSAGFQEVALVFGEPFVLHGGDAYWLAARADDIGACVEGCAPTSPGVLFEGFIVEYAGAPAQ